MGLCNSASTFQRLMNMVLAGLTYSICLVYLDDIIVMAPSVDEHHRRLEEVFQTNSRGKVEAVARQVSDSSKIRDVPRTCGVRSWDRYGSEEVRSSSRLADP